MSQFLQGESLGTRKKKSQLSISKSCVISLSDGVFYAVPCSFF